MSKSTRKKLSSAQKAVAVLIGLLISLTLIMVLGEVVSRTFLGIQPVEKHNPPPPYNTAQKDDELGWKMTPDYAFDGTVTDTEGKGYPVNIKYDSNGFKAFGNLKSKKKKVFFIGDSYTACIEVSNKKSFYNLLKDSIDIEVFAYGHAGFGTLQEYMILKKYLPIIKPDIVVWETCSNDFIDNYAPLELESGYKVGERRPYLTLDDEIVYERPVTMMKKLSEHSSFCRFLDEKWKNISYEYLNKDKRVAEYWIGEIKDKYPPYAQSIQITNLVFDKVKNELPKETLLIGFSADTYEPQTSDFKAIFNSHGFEFLTKPAGIVYQAKISKEVVHSSDGYHWNEKGHELIAKGLLETLSRD
ncbi:MAG: hypothetical protein ACI85O_003921 [Saprospiraceae bacterium]|jgi:hypothetical protein